MGEPLRRGSRSPRQELRPERRADDARRRDAAPLLQDGGRGLQAGAARPLRPGAADALLPAPGAPQARGDPGSGGGRSQRRGAACGEALSRGVPREIPGRGRDLGGRDHRAVQDDTLHARGGGGPAAAHRVQQRRQHAAEPRHGARARDGAARLARGDPRAARAPAAGREPAARGPGRGRGLRLLVPRPARARARDPRGPLPARGRDQPEHEGAGLQPARRARDVRRLRPGAGAAHRAPRPRRPAQGLGQGWRRRVPRAPAERGARDRRDRALAGPAHRRGSADAQLRQAADRGHGLQSGARAARPHAAAARRLRRARRQAAILRAGPEPPPRAARRRGGERGELDPSLRRHPVGGGRSGPGHRRALGGDLPALHGGLLRDARAAAAARAGCCPPWTSPARDRSRW